MVSRLIYANYCPQYNLAGKSDTTFSSEINRFDEITQDTVHTINKAIDARNISEPKLNHTQVKTSCSDAFRRIQIPSHIFSGV